MNSYGENSFGLRTFRFTNDLQERIKFVNRGLTVVLQETARYPIACDYVVEGEMLTSTSLGMSPYLTENSL